MARGLYGALIVEEPAPPRADRDEVLLIDDWRLTGDAGIHESFGAMMDLSHAGRIGNWVTVNGAGELRLPVKRRERLRLRLVNTADARIFTLGLTGMEGWIVALDGQPLDAPRRCRRRTAGSPSPPRNAPICSWTSPPGTARGRRSFRYRTARRCGSRWSTTPPGPMRCTCTATISAGWARTGVPEGGAMRDTVLLDRNETASEIAFVADNPGDWLLHCHMLEHAAAGMRTWIRVEA